MTGFWHKEAPQNVAVMLMTNLLSGLTAAEAQHRLNKFGLTTLNKQKKSSAFKIFHQQFNSLVIWVLLGAVVISFTLNEKIDGYFVILLIGWSLPLLPIQLAWIVLGSIPLIVIGINKVIAKRASNEF